MTAMESHTYHGTSCDVRGCPSTITTVQTIDVPYLNSQWGPGWKAHTEAAARAGWAAYAGRSVFEYCPDHGPALRKPGKFGIIPDPMRRLWGSRPDYDAQAEALPERRRRP